MSTEHGTGSIDDLPDKHEVIQEHYDILERIAREGTGPFASRCRRLLETNGYAVDSGDGQ